MTHKTDIIEDILVSLRRVIRAIDQHSRKLVQSHGLTGPQAILLNEIVRSESLTGSELARRVSLSQPTVTDIVKRLEGQELVRKTRDQLDKRKFLITPTATGKALVEKSLPLLQENFQLRLSELKDWEQTQLLSSLQRIAEMMNAEELDAAPLLASGAVTASAEAVEQAISPDEPDNRLVSGDDDKQ